MDTERRKPVKDKQELTKRFVEYFEDIAISGEHPLMSALALTAGVGTTTVRRWVNDEGHKYHDVAVWARTMVEYGYEKGLAKDPGRAGGLIFALKNLGWKDKTEVATSFTFADMVKAAADPKKQNKK